MQNATEEKKTTTATAAKTTAPQQQTTQQTAQQEVEAPKNSYTASGSTGKQKTYNSTMQTLQATEYTAPTFTSDYDQTISDLYDKITNREPFKYDYSTDPLYGQYKEAYTQQGKQAMKDTMGQAAALTGGYGSSYGQAVGQQQYDAYLQRLNDVMPELYNTAFAQYQEEGNALRDAYTMANQQRESEYSKYRDTVADLQYREQMDRQKEETEYAHGRDEVADQRYVEQRDWERQQYEDAQKRQDAETEYSHGRDDVKDKQYEDAKALQEAEARAQYGDFSGYGAIYGEETQHRMALTWAAASPANGQVAFDSQQITGDDYFNLYGSYPRGYTGAQTNTYTEPNWAIIGTQLDYRVERNPETGLLRYVTTPSGEPQKALDGQG